MTLRTFTSKNLSLAQLILAYLLFLFFNSQTAYSSDDATSAVVDSSTPTQDSVFKDHIFQLDAQLITASFIAMQVDFDAEDDLYPSKSEDIVNFRHLYLLLKKSNRLQKYIGITTDFNVKIQVFLIQSAYDIFQIISCLAPPRLDILSSDFQHDLEELNAYHRDYENLDLLKSVDFEKRKMIFQNLIEKNALLLEKVLGFFKHYPKPPEKHLLLIEKAHLEEKHFYNSAQAYLGNIENINKLLYRYFHRAHFLAPNDLLNCQFLASTFVAFNVDFSSSFRRICSLTCKELWFKTHHIGKFIEIWLQGEFKGLQTGRFKDTLQWLQQEAAQLADEDILPEVSKRLHPS